MLQLVGSGTVTSYINKGGASGVPRISTSGVFRASDTFYPGAKGNAAISVQGTIGATAFGVVVGVERIRNDPNNSGRPAWSKVGTYRTDQESYSGVLGFAAPQLTQTILRTDFSGSLVDTSSGALVSGGAGTTLAVTLTTQDLFLATGGARVIARACSGAFLSGDTVTFAVDCG